MNDPLSLNQQILGRRVRFIVLSLALALLLLQIKSNHETQAIAIACV